jgi:hypothetical protein
MFNEINCLENLKHIVSEYADEYHFRFSADAFPV